MGQIFSYAYSLPMSLIDGFYHCTGLSSLVKALDWNAKPTLDDVRASIQAEVKLCKTYSETYLDAKLWRRFIRTVSDGLWDVCDREEFWGKIAQKQISNIKEKGPDSTMPEPLFDRALQMIDERQERGSKLAIEIGCGGDTLHPQLLLDRGWSVVLVEKSQVAAELLTSSFQEAIESGRLKIVCQDVADYEFPKNVALIYAYEVLPYCDPQKILSIWTKIYDALKEDGLFVGNLLSSKWYGNVYQRLLGAWYIKRAHAEVLLESQNYQIEILKDNREMPHDSINIEFIARK